MATTRLDITVNQGSAFKLNIQALNSDKTVMDLTGYLARMQVRESPESVSVLMSATTEDGGITINSPGGVVMINISAALTTLMVWNTGVWDLEIYTDAANVIRLVKGFASLSQEVTR
jgi:hypothetical protein